MKDGVEHLCRALGFSVSAGQRILLKPNLVSGGASSGLSCTHPRFVVAVAQWCLDHGARVAVGDSPAFGSARSVMAACGLLDALGKLPVRLADFSKVRRVRLASGEEVGLAEEALQCDELVNLPRVKAHGQLFVTLAVKNYFGTVVGLRKPCWHMRHGGQAGRFEELLVDLLAVLPGGISLADGIEAMHRDGPVSGEPFALGVLGASRNPVALDTALLEILRLSPGASPLWREAARRRLPGVRLNHGDFVLNQPAELARAGFQAPAELQPIRFQPWRVARGVGKRLLTFLVRR